MDSQLSQRTTQTRSATTTSKSYTESSICENEPWGRLVYYKMAVRTMGIGKQPTFVEVPDSERIFEMAGPTFSVGSGKKNDLCCESLEIENPKRFSNIHFRLSKDLDDPCSPVIIEDTSTHGTSVNSHFFRNEKRILLNNDKITVCNQPPVVFIFKKIRAAPRSLPAGIVTKFHIGKRLGSGGFGRVYSVHKRSCKQFALKFIDKARYDDQNVLKAEIEASILRELDHPCIIRIHDVISCPGDGIALLLDIMIGGDLHTRIETNHFLCEDNAKYIFFQICAGVKYLHGRRVIHRDIKPENILLETHEMYTPIKITDFGLSKMIHNNSVLRTVCGTPVYVAPEIVENQGAEYTNKVDVWSLGVLLAFALSGDVPSEECVRVTFTPNDQNPVTQTVTSLMAKMLEVDPNKRPSIAKVISDPWLRDNRIIDAARAAMNVTVSSDSHRSRSPLMNTKQRDCRQIATDSSSHY